MSYYIGKKGQRTGRVRWPFRDLASIAVRIAAALVGSYAFTWCFTAFGIAALVALEVDFHESETAMLLLAFIVFLSLFLWAFAAASLPRTVAVLSGGAVLMGAAALGLQWAMLP